MADETGKDLAQRFIAALRSIESEGHGAVESMAALFAAGATLTNPALQQTGSRRDGRDGARAFWNAYADTFTGARTEFNHVTIGEHAIGLFWTTAGGSAGPGQEPLGYDGATLIEHDATGSITGFRGYYDTQALKTTATG
ncbi:MAG TPA: nuclear transport factor 2 family protein [Caldimonas sp.]|jgi:hypothetical protein|nr:nuclear transport factor 2 family protein [Caldimonas sp.]HEX2542922.1 nuclear transport factor 2 family protein [Caldimonas sp.]